MQKLGLTGASKHQSDDQMKGISAVLLDGEQVFVDNGAIHAKSRVETGIKFVEDKDAVPNPRYIAGLWVTLKRTDKGMGYNGAMPFELWIDAEAKLGYKKLSEQVNHMDKAVRGQVDVSRYSPEIVAKFGTFLKTFRADLWENAPETFKAAFADAADS
ncbi:YwhD family protein [Alicyclobacillus acidiphilus]|uniref:YwhD family protein n=1 Tax=Alicyclobacillus acidiphilus TaxID=182455 RepID=UPI000832AEBE|nr:YwhD family protein [Alicyclobacillus acidiphilus]